MFLDKFTDMPTHAKIIRDFSIMTGHDSDDEISGPNVFTLPADGDPEHGSPERQTEDGSRPMELRLEMHNHMKVIEPFRPVVPGDRESASMQAMNKRLKQLRLAKGRADSKHKKA